MTYIACSNKKLVDDQKLEGIIQREKVQIEIEEKELLKSKPKNKETSKKEKKDI